MALPRESIAVLTNHTFFPSYPGRHPVHAPAPLRPPAQSRHRLRRRFRPLQAPGAAGYLRHPRHLALRLLLRGERFDRVPDGGAARDTLLHRLAGRREIQEASQLLSALDRRL